MKKSKIKKRPRVVKTSVLKEDYSLHWTDFRATYSSDQADSAAQITPAESIYLPLSTGLEAKSKNHLTLFQIVFIKGRKLVKKILWKTFLLIKINGCHWKLMLVGVGSLRVTVICVGMAASYGEELVWTDGFGDAEPTDYESKVLSESVTGHTRARRDTKHYRPERQKHTERSPTSRQHEIDKADTHIIRYFNHGLFHHSNGDAWRNLVFTLKPQRERAESIPTLSLIHHHYCYKLRPRLAETQTIILVPSKWRMLVPGGEVALFDVNFVSYSKKKKKKERRVDPDMQPNRLLSEC